LSHISADDLSLHVTTPPIFAQRVGPADNIVREFTYAILAYDTEKDGYVKIGEMEVGVVDLGLAWNERQSLAEACESHSDQYHEMESALFTRQGSFKQVVRKALGDSLFDTEGLMYIETLFIDPAHRGKKLGRAALYALMRYGTMGCGSIFLKAHPFTEDTSRSEKKRERDCAALRNYYEGLGFARVSNTNFMGICLNYDLPALQD